MSDIDGGGPAFPGLRDTEDGLGNPVRVAYEGMTKRELFAAILMHAEMVTCGVPGEAAEALVEASRDADDDVVDHMAGNAVEGADALLRALAEPKPPVPRFDYDASAASTEEKEAVKQLTGASYFHALPEDTRDFILHAAYRIQIEEDGIPF